MPLQRQKEVFTASVPQSLSQRLCSVLFESYRLGSAFGIYATACSWQSASRIFIVVPMGCISVGSFFFFQEHFYLSASNLIW